MPPEMDRGRLKTVFWYHLPYLFLNKCFQTTSRIQTSSETSKHLPSRQIPTTPKE